ncbi:MAG TPA: ATP-dependent helicase [Gemmatimonadaceae bacterium]|jgi:superfamily I DNA/RNA helicase
MAWNDNLQVGTPAHSIAASVHTRIRVLAGPGTGKSFAMKRRVARLLEVDGISPTRLLAVTFTRVAAEDLHRELISLGVNGADQLRGKTLHSLAMAILMRNHVLAVMGRTPRPLNKFELEPLLADLSRTHGDKHARRRLMLAYGAAWARLQAQQPGYARSAADQAFVDDLVAWLRFHKAMLMDEIIPHLHQYLQANPGAPERTEYEHLLVDEFQDLNRAEQDVLHFLGQAGSICVIGDDDQSIYSFRHAHPDGIREWATLQPTDEHAITECRRCPTTVVRMANALIAQNTGRVAGRAMTERAVNGPGDVAIRQYSTADQEAEAVATKIASLIAAGVSPGEIVVLTQRATFAEPIFERLRASDVPVKSYYAEAALDSLEAQERFAILKLLLDSEDRVALRWLLGRGKSDWRTTPYRRLMAYVNAHHASPWLAMSALSAGTLTLPYTASLVERFKEIQLEMGSLRAAADLAEFVRLWLPASPATTLLAEAVAECSDGLTTQQELFDALYATITQPEVPIEVSEVRIMSLHKSKGLSSPFVFIVGCVEGLLPAQADSAMTPDEQMRKLEEDRRLFYVGITRVKADLPQRDGYLAITYARTMAAAAAFASQISPVRVSRGTAHLQASRFIGEMAPHVPVVQFNAPL